MKKIHYITVAFTVLTVLLLGAIFLTGEKKGEYDDFAKCLADAGLAMYGTDWCGHCEDQKEMFGDSFKYVDFVNCDFEGDVCDEVGVPGFPTWGKDGDIIAIGAQSFLQLAYFSGCEY